MSFAIVANQSNITIVSTVDTVGYRAKDLINAAALVSDVQHARIGALAKQAGMVIAGSSRSEASFKGGPPGGLWAGAAWVPWCRSRCRDLPVPAVVVLRQIATSASRKRGSGVS